MGHLRRGISRISTMFAMSYFLNKTESKLWWLLLCVILAGPLCPYICSKIMLGVSMKAFFGWDWHLNQWTWSWANYPLWCAWASSNQVKAQIEERLIPPKQEGLLLEELSPESPTCQLPLQILDWPSHHNHVSQFFKLNFSLYMYIHIYTYALFLGRTLRTNIFKKLTFVDSGKINL